jgi:hypothetical protein
MRDYRRRKAEAAATGKPAKLVAPAIERLLREIVSRQTARMFPPAWAAFKIPMICSSVNLARFIVPPVAFQLKS